MSEWKDVVKRVRASRDPIFGDCVASYDTETHDEGFPDSYIVGFSMAWYETTSHGVHTKNGCYVPIQHKTGELQLPPEAIRDDLASLLEDPDIRIVMHNAPYDILQSRTLGIDINENIDDTMMMAMMLNTNGIGSLDQITSGNGLKGLKDITEFYFGHKMQELTALAPRVNHPKDPSRNVLLVEKVPIAKLGPYAWDDGIQTLSHWEMFWMGFEEYERRYPDKVRKLSHKYREVLHDVMTGLLNLPKMRTVYEKVEREFAFCLADMQEFGLPLNVGKIEAMRAQVEEERRTLAGEMFAARPGEDFEPWLDHQTVGRCAAEYEALEQRYALPKDHPNYPTRRVTKGEGRGKARKTWTEKESLPVGTGRKEVFQRFGLDGTPIEQKIRDDSVRPFVIEHPELVHKIFNLNSTPQLRTIFFDEIGCPILGRSKKSGEPSTAGEYIEEWAAMDYPMMRPMLRFREIDKLYGTYMVGMPNKVGSDGRIRTRYGRVRTWRLSSSDPNLQNIPTSSEFPIREAFEAYGILYCDVEVLEWYRDEEKDRNLKPRHVRVTAREGNEIGLEGGWEMREGRILRWWGKNPPWVMKVADYSQLEIRLLAFISKDPILVRAVASGEDIHALTARAVFDEIPNDMSLEDVKKLFSKLRKDAKPVNFGVIYGMGPKTLAIALNISVEEAQKLIDQRYMGYYRGVKVWIDDRHRFVVRYGFVEYATGRRRHLPEGMLDPNAPDPSGDLDRHGRPKTQWWKVAGAQRQSQNCVDAETEILTEGGWKRHDEVSVGDRILTKNPDTGGLEWHPVQKMNVFPNSTGRLVEFESKTFSALTTENHRWFVYNKSTGRDEFKTSGELSVHGDHRIHRTGEYSGEVLVSDDWVRLAGWFLTDGSLQANTSGRTYKAYLCQSHRANPEKCARIEQLLHRNDWVRRTEVMPERYSATKWHLHMHVANALAEQFPGRVLTPEFVSKLTGEQARLLVKVMIDGDGYREVPQNENQNGRRRLSCATEKQARAFQMACVLAGYATNAVYRDMSMYEPQSDKLRNVPKQTGIWIVSVLNRDKVQVVKSQKREFESDGRLVWCPTVKNQTFVARRRGTVYITGNSPIQGFASDVIGLAMRDCRRWLRETTVQDVVDASGLMAPDDGIFAHDLSEMLFRNYVRVCLQVHDELVSEAHPAVANYVMDQMVERMEEPGGLKLVVKLDNEKIRIPLDVDAALGADWFNTKE